MQKRQGRLWVRPMRSCFQSNIRRSKLIFNTSRSSFLEHTLSQPHIPEMAKKFYWRISLGYLSDISRIEYDTRGRQLLEGTAGNPERFGGGSRPISSYNNPSYSRETSLCFHPIRHNYLSIAPPFCRRYLLSPRHMDADVSGTFNNSSQVFFPTTASLFRQEKK
jgi:hypothetical protein